MEAVGADGCGLFRTEFAFMTRSRYPDVHTQAAHYRDALDTAAGRPVAFRTLDVGSDKHLPYWRMPPEDNPAMGWRALRMVLDRPDHHARPAARAGAGGVGPAPAGHVPDGGRGGRARGCAAAARDGARPRRGAAAIELPSGSRSAPWSRCRRSTGSSTRCCKRVDFLSIGSNDLFQFLFACDRGNPALVDRYDVLSPPALSFFHDMVQRCRGAGVRLAVCGEMASRPLEAMALIGLGIH